MTNRFLPPNSDPLGLFNRLGNRSQRATSSRSFIPALEELRRIQGSPLEIINALYATFHSITQMDADEVVASYQSLELMASQLGLLSDPVVVSLSRGMEAQMIQLGVNNFSLRARFASVAKLDRGAFSRF